MDKQKTVPIQLDISPDNLETLTTDLKRLGEGLDKACSKGIFGLNQMLSDIFGRLHIFLTVNNEVIFNN